MIFITTYHSPDTDGISCSIAYKELMEKQGKAAEITYFGDLSREVEFVRKYTSFFPAKRHEGKYPSDAEFILVDAADPEAVEPTIFPERVKAVFDHRELVFTAKFINAEIKIEKVGSCATLMTELFSKGRKIPSQKTAVWLYSAIISNTVNFKNTVTTQRDIEAATWLRPMAKVDRDYVRKMFEYKSRIRNEKELRFLIDQDFSTKELYGKKVGIAQIEIAKLEKMLASYNTVIRKVLKEYLAGESLDYVLFTGVDIVEGFNVFMVADKKSGAFFSKVLGISNVGGKFKRRGIIMRKQIWPKIEVVLKRMVQ